MALSCDDAAGRQHLLNRASRRLLFDVYAMVVPMGEWLEVASRYEEYV